MELKNRHGQKVSLTTDEIFINVVFYDGNGNE
ncbi:hypothetical protein QE443_001872 [Pantoea ananatis]|nr:hypothetical protein [Pantoea ananatis]